MEAELPQLIELLRFAEENLGRYITLFLTTTVGLAGFTMSETFRTKFTWVGKAILTIALSAVAWNNLSNLVHYTEIFNAAALQLNMCCGEGFWSTLFGSTDGVLQQKPLWHVYGGHMAGSVIVLFLLWRENLLTFVKKIRK
jgi:hypothetical protein